MPQQHFFDSPSPEEQSNSACHVTLFSFRRKVAPAFEKVVSHTCSIVTAARYSCRITKTFNHLQLAAFEPLKYGTYLHRCYPLLAHFDETFHVPKNHSMYFCCHLLNHAKYKGINDTTLGPKKVSSGKMSSRTVWIWHPPSTSISSVRRE